MTNRFDPDEMSAEAERLALDEDEWQAHLVREEDSYEAWRAWHEEHAPERLVDDEDGAP